MSKENSNPFRIGPRVFAGTTLGFLLVAGAGGWAATMQLSGAVIAQGQIAVDQQIKAVQHRDGGIVSEIAVREGDQVKEGQVLLRLDDAQTRAELSIVRAQLLELSVRRARLLAERDLLAHIEFPGDLDIRHAHQTVVIGAADPQTADYLKIALGAPTAQCRCVVIDAAGIAIYVADITYRSDVIKLHIDLLANSRAAAGRIGSPKSAATKSAAAKSAATKPRTDSAVPRVPPDDASVPASRGPRLSS